MATMYDAPMQDFTGDTNMDADMLPSMSTETDWLQAEGMMDDGANEVEMANEEVQEFEMTDAEAAEMFEYQETSPDFIEYQDQELPDASRAVSPSIVLPYQDHEQVPTITPLDYSDLVGTVPIASELTAHEHNTEPNRSTNDQQEDILKEKTASDGKPIYVETSLEILEEPLASPDALHSDVSAGITSKEVVNVASHDAALASLREGGNMPSNVFPEHDIKPESTEPEVEPHNNSGTNGKINTVEITQSHDNVESYYSVETCAEEVEEQVENTEVVHDEPGDNDENVNATQDEDDVASSADQPPCVMLSFAFDGASYALFELPGDTIESLGATNELQPSHQSDRRDEKPQEANVASRNELVLLFKDRSHLYYEPISSIFAVLRADETTNVGGRFDQNIELILSAPDLDLTLPEVRMHLFFVYFNTC